GRSGGEGRAESLEAVPSETARGAVEARVRGDGRGAYRLAAHRGYPKGQYPRLDAMVVPSPVAEAFIGSFHDPFVIAGDLLEGGPEQFRRWEGRLDVLGAPMRWEPDGLGGVAIVAPDEAYRFTERDIRLARGI